MSRERSRSHSPEALAALALALLPGVGCAGHRDLIAAFGSARRALDDAARAEREAAERDARRALDQGTDRGLTLLHGGHPEFPSSLQELDQPPPVLWVAGRPELLSMPAVAIVGTRNATRYGERVTHEISAALARAGMVVVSGMARGIDGVAHQAALAVSGSTVAVLGTGADMAYPSAHRQLRDAIARTGAVVAEALPGTGATPGAFPRRNRLIAALATATIVVEAGARSGALLTAQHALELGRTVAAVPGPIDSPQSVGSNELIRDGALVIATVADALALVGRTAPVAFRAPPEDADAARAWRVLADGPADLDSLATRSGLPASRCLAAVTRLELSGAVECELTGVIRRR